MPRQLSRLLLAVLSLTLALACVWEFAVEPTIWDTGEDLVHRIEHVIVVAVITSLALLGPMLVLARAEARRRETGAALAEAQRMARLGSWEWRIPEGRVSWSEEVYHLFGEDPECFEPSYEGFLARIHPDDRARVEAAIQAALASGGQTSHEHRIVRPDGEVRLLHGVARTERDAHGRPLSMVGSAQDITELRAAEAQVRRLNAELEERVRRRTAELRAANRELEAFSYSVSHDLRAPLRAINGFAQALEEDCAQRLDEQGRSHLARIREASRRMGDLIDDLLTLSRLGRHELAVAEVDLSRLAREVGEELAGSAPGHPVELLVQEGLIVRGDPRLLRLTVQNLLDNAWKFTRGRSPARIQVGFDPEQRAYFVRDNGVGFDPAYVDRLFAPFQRLHRADQFPGTGVGLATVQRLVQRHGGRTWAEAVEGEGAAFYFTLPAPTQDGHAHAACG